MAQWGRLNSFAEVVDALSRNKALIVTGKSLNNMGARLDSDFNTPLFLTCNFQTGIVRRIEDVFKSAMPTALRFTDWSAQSCRWHQKLHSRIGEFRRGLIVSIGGGSPIDASKFNNIPPIHKSLEVISTSR